MKKVILDLCGGTGAWSKPYKDAGYEVMNVTLPNFDVTMTEFYQEFMEIGRKTSYGASYTTIWYRDIYGILAAPPCTMFSLARTRAKKPRDFREGMEIVSACLMIIWETRIRVKLTFWALENPMGCLRQFLGRPLLTFNPCDYGDPYTKKTDLWGYYNMPKLHPVKPKFIIDKGKGHKRYSPNHFHTSGNTDKGKEYRSVTPPGFASAFFEANK